MKWSNLIWGIIVIYLALGLLYAVLTYSIFQGCPPRISGEYACLLRRTLSLQEIFSWNFWEIVFLWPFYILNVLT